MKRLELIIVTVVALCLGTAMHFVHHVPFFGPVLGCIFPVNECVWEHMKMLFYPMLLVSLYMCLRERTVQPFGGMAFACLACIPVQIAAFFGYWVFTREVIEIIDIVAFVIVMCTGICFGNNLAAKPSVRRRWPLAIAVDVLMIALLAVLTTYHPDWLLFDPTL